MSTIKQAASPVRTIDEALVRLYKADVKKFKVDPPRDHNEWTIRDSGIPPRLAIALLKKGYINAGRGGVVIDMDYPLNMQLTPLGAQKAQAVIAKAKEESDLFWAQHKQAGTIKQALLRVASEVPESRQFIIPLLQRHATCACGDERLAGELDEKSEYNKKYVQQRWPGGVDRSKYKNKEATVNRTALLARMAKVQAEMDQFKGKTAGDDSQVTPALRAWSDAAAKALGGRVSKFKVTPNHTGGLSGKAEIEVPTLPSIGGGPTEIQIEIHQWGPSQDSLKASYSYYLQPKWSEEFLKATTGSKWLSVETEGTTQEVIRAAQAQAQAAHRILAPIMDREAKRRSANKDFAGAAAAIYKLMAATLKRSGLGAGPIEAWGHERENTITPDGVPYRAEGFVIEGLLSPGATNDQAKEVAAKTRKVLIQALAKFNYHGVVAKLTSDTGKWSAYKYNAYFVMAYQGSEVPKMRLFASPEENNAHLATLMSDSQYDGLTKGKRLFITYKSTYEAGEQEFMVGRTTYSEKYNVYSKQLFPIVDGAPVLQGQAKWILFKRDYGVSLAHGSMGVAVLKLRIASTSSRLAELRAQRTAASLSLQEGLEAVQDAGFTASSVWKGRRLYVTKKSRGKEILFGYYDGRVMQFESGVTSFDRRAINTALGL